MTELQTALVLAGVGVVVLVYFYNWWVSMRRRREIERAVAAHSGRSRASAPDPLDAPAATAAGARREPVVERIEPVSAPADSPVATGFEEPPAGDTAARVEPAMVMAPAAKPAAAQARAEPYLAAAPAVAPAAAPVAPAVSVAPPVQRVEAAPVAAPRVRPARPGPSGLALRPDPPEADSRVDYLLRLLPLEPVLAEDLAEILAGAPESGRRMTVLGCPVGSQEWQPVLRQSVRYEELAFALQQVDRGGLIERSSLDRFVDWVDRIAEQVSAGCNSPDPDEAHGVAAAFDAFCAEVDVLIGINVVAPDVPVPGTKVRALVEAAGFRLQPSGQYMLQDDDGMTLLTLADIEGSPFVAERIRTAAMSGVTLLLDIPRTRKPTRVFNQMIQIARQIAQGIAGRVVDDQRQNLTDAGIRVISGRVAALENRLNAQQMAPGSALARRVFE
ncbi:MAG: cell division protein ZipA C-terminal FtsZ-binding domain-containing protein [Burkholderiales bacterium]